MPFDGFLPGYPIRGNPASHVAAILAGWKPRECQGHLPGKHSLPMLMALLIRKPHREVRVMAIQTNRPMPPALLCSRQHETTLPGPRAR